MTEHEFDYDDEDAAPVATPRVRDAVADAAQRARDLEEALIGTAEVLALPEKLLMKDGKVPRGNSEIARAAGLRAAACSGGASRLRPYLLDVGHPKAAQVRKQCEELVAAEARWMALEKANK